LQRRREVRMKMGRFVLILGTVVVLGAFAPMAGTAWAGGGCYQGATQGTGVVVELVDACFSPSTLRIASGDTVTFVNRDGIVHNVGGIGWGHPDDLQPGARFTMSFGDDGVYPFACTYHQGMTGAIVVGDGSGAGNGAVANVTLPQDPAPKALQPEPVSTAGSARWLVAGVAGIALGLAAGYAISRSRRSSAALAKV
jgi:plastocyanin